MELNQTIGEPIWLNYAPRANSRMWKGVYVLFLCETLLLLVGGLGVWRFWHDPAWSPLRAYDDLFVALAYLPALLALIGLAVRIGRMIPRGDFVTRCRCLGMLGASAVMFEMVVMLSVVD